MYYRDASVLKFRKQRVRAKFGNVIHAVIISRNSTPLRRRRCRRALAARMSLYYITLLHYKLFTPWDRKKESIFSLCIFFSRPTWQKLVIFFTYIKPKESRSISYNSMHLILQRQWHKIFCVYQSSNKISDYRLVFIVSISLFLSQPAQSRRQENYARHTKFHYCAKFLMHAKIKYMQL